MSRIRRPKRQQSAAPLPQVITELTIDALGQQGDGLAQYDGQPVFVPFALPGEHLRLRFGGTREKGRVAQIEEVLIPAADRVEPPCRHFGICGGCALQHLDLNAYRRWKIDTVRQTLSQRAIVLPDKLHSIFIPAATRRRAVFAVAGDGRNCHIGFHRSFSHDVVDLRECLLLTPGLFALIAQLRSVLQGRIARGETWDLLATESETGLDLLITAKAGPTSTQRLALAELCQTADIARISWLVAGTKRDAVPEPIAQNRMPQIRFAGIVVDLPHQSFLQPSLAGEAALREAVLASVGDAKHVADLFAGCGTFTFPLAQRAKVLAAEGSKAAVQALVAASRRGQVADRITAEQRDLDDAPLMAEQLKKIDAIVFDPPRAGARQQAEQIARSAVPLAVGVSCNPASFARDARILIDGGFRLTDLTVVDQFIWSPHVELVGRFER